MRRLLLLTSIAALVAAVLPAAPASADVNTAIQFAPATITSAHFLGSEPMQSIERPVAGTLNGAINPDRIFVDSIFGFGNGTTTLSRSLDHGDTFRPILDLTCANRNRPTCFTNGGGDGIERVNLYDGTVYFGDQEAVAQETLGSSIDHGDTWPAPRQQPFGNATTGVDRQWIATVNKPGILVTPPAPAPQVPVELRAFYEYHIPAAGSYVQGIDSNGLLIPQPDPQITGVGQSSFTRVDSVHNLIYQPYWATTGSNMHVSVAPFSGYQTAAGWTDHVISSDLPAIFIGFNLDSAGNAYAAWTPSSPTGGRVLGAVYLSASLLSDPANDPVSGHPGSTWTPPVKISDGSVGATAFIEVVAGDPGRVAVHYLGTQDYTGQSDNAPNGSRWHSYVAFITGAGTSPVITTAQVDHRVIHTGSVCTGGTTCLGDRSMADTNDIGIDANGCVGVNWQDNNSQMARDKGTGGGTSPTVMGNPFTHYAMEVQGPSLFANAPSCNRAIPTDTRTKAPGTATWPNTAAGTEIPALDVLGTTISTPNATDLVGRITLSNASVAAMNQAITTFNAPPGTAVPATRLLYVLRFSTDYVSDTNQGDVDFLAMEYTAGSPLKFFGEKLDGDDAVTSGAGTAGPAYRGATYHADPTFTVTGSITGNTIEIHGLQSQFGLASGSRLYSVTAFGMAGPAENTEVDVKNLMRTVGVTAPFDTVLSTGPVVPEVPLVALFGIVGLLAATALVYRRRHLA